LFGQPIRATLSTMTELERIGARYKALTAELVELRPQLASAIVKAAKAGTRQTDLARLSGYTRERIRQICRAAGIEPPA
jgi:predicted transcriptional regulator